MEEELRRNLSSFKARMEEVMSGRDGRSRSSRRKNYSTTPPGRSGLGHAATARRRTTFTGSARTSGRKSRSRGRREPRGSPRPTSSSRRSRRERAGGDTRRRRSSTPPPPRPDLPPPEGPPSQTGMKSSNICSIFRLVIAI